MKITLRKVGTNPFEFEKKLDGVELKGFLQRDKENLILLQGSLSGNIETECSICGDEFDLEVDEYLNFFISDGVYIDEENKNIDVVETKNGELDVDELIKSEIELIRSDYHACEFCEMGED